MPSLTSYSPYETLVFFQNVAYYGADKESLQNISSALNQNQLIRESEDYDASKFSPDALDHLYKRTINAQKEDLPNSVNGDTTSTNGNPLKRKLSPSPTPGSSQDTDQFLQQFVDKLYAKFKEETLKELRLQEDEYRKLQDQISALEDQVKAEEANKAEETTEASNVDVGSETVEPTRPSSATQIDRPDPVSAQLQANLEAANHDVKSPAQPVQPQIQPQPPPATPQLHEGAQHSATHNQRASTPKSSAGTPLARHAQTPQLPPSNQLHSPGAFNRTLPPPSPQRNTYGSLPPPPHAFPTHPQNQAPPPMLPPIHGLQRMPSHEGYSPRAPSQGRGSPMPQHPPQGYPQYPQYQQPPPHAWHSPGPQQYPQPQHPAQQHFTPPTSARYGQVHTPNQQPYQPYSHTAPVPYQNQPSQQHWHGPPVAHYHQYPASTSNTPVQRPDGRATVARSRSSTPWKKRNMPPGFRPRSPSRLDREISPISDTGSPPPETPAEKTENLARGNNTAAKKRPRDESVMPAGNLSRSQSVISNTSEAPNPPKRKVGRPPKIKPEPPSTPAQMTSDSEQQQRSSGRRGRARTSANTNKLDVSRATIATKRKRDAPSASPAPRGRSTSQAQAPTAPRSSNSQADANLVIVSKTFGRTSQLLLNEITSHKLGGIFAKPLSEREAPGYKSLIYRPQDLKSIKAAIGKGSRAAISSIEKLESEAVDGDNEHSEKDDGPTPTPTPKTGGSISIPQSGNLTNEGPIGNGFYLVRTTEELIPPKGIANSAQLEMELVRMFANAVMFNPLPTSERGFGRSLRLRKYGGELPQYGARQAKAKEPEGDASAGTQGRGESESATTATSTSESDSAGSDEGGIIADAREMFADVEKLVARWRDLEGGGGGGGSGGGGVWQGTLSTPLTGSAIERHASVSASSFAGEEDGGGGDVTPSASFAGSVRKRRKMGDR